MAGKSASNEGSELLKFGSMLAASITELKDTMPGKFDQLGEIGPTVMAFTRGS